MSFLIGRYCARPFNTYGGLQRHKAGGSPHRFRKNRNIKDEAVHLASTPEGWLLLDQTTQLEVQVSRVFQVQKYIVPYWTSNLCPTWIWAKLHSSGYSATDRSWTVYVVDKRNNQPSGHRESIKAELARFSYIFVFQQPLRHIIVIRRNTSVFNISYFESLFLYSKHFSACQIENKESSKIGHFDASPHLTRLFELEPLEVTYLRSSFHH